ncbi:WD repeat-containing protein 43 isoform X2 [Ananas comosus]|uniref:WD repeat-containing protein 43 isoform X2 n=1 Tax=Ananas comosus TaxID=4615 RepID=A0A6P5GJ38_ANACO|nr:WD repeat-containing protein 43 isoform X2 [Ananas comosus]
MGGEKSPSLLSSFTSDGDRFAVLSPDGTIRILDTLSGTVVAEWRDLYVDSTISYSCISCGYIGKKRKRDQKTFLLAIGTETGDVLAVDILTNQKRWVNSECHSGGVAALCFTKKGRILYSAGTDGMVYELNSDTGENIGQFNASKRSITSLTLSRDEKVMAVASNKTRLFSWEDKKELLKIPSDYGTVQYIAVSDDGDVAVSSVTGHKQLQMWSFDHENERSTAEFALSMQSIPIMLECRGSKKTDSLYVLSVSEKGIAYVWHLKSMSRDGVLRTKILVKSKKPILDEGKGGKKDRVPIVSAMLCYAEEDAQASVLVAFGSLDNLQFRFVEVNDSGKDIYLTADNEMSVDKTLRTHTDSNAEEIDGDIKSSNLGETTTPSQRKRAKKRMTPDSDTANEVREPVAEFDLDEPTMAEKLASLDLQNGENEKSDVEKASSPTIKPPSADSVHVLLKQALHADDHSLLLDCLYTRDEKVIANSISLLTPADVLKLLKSIMLMIQSRGAVLICVIPWLRSLLGQHASSIASQDSSLQLLNSLYQLIDSRISTFGSALQLSTCLDYLFVGICDDEADDEATTLPIIYEDKDSEEEEGEESEDGDAMETDDNEELGDVIDAPHYSDGSEVMSD